VDEQRLGDLLELVDLDPPDAKNRRRPMSCGR
jgi:hypothetical protein